MRCLICARVGHWPDILLMTIEAANITGPGDWPGAPASCPLTMSYDGIGPTGFKPQPKTHTVHNIPVIPGITCAGASVSGPTASAVCAYDLAATQIFPATPTTPAAALPATVTPTFTGKPSGVSARARTTSRR